MSIATASTRPITCDDYPNFTEARDTLHRARQVLAVAKRRAEALFHQQHSPDRVLAYEAVRDFRLQQPLLMEAEISCQKAQREFDAIRQAAEQTVQRHWLAKQREVWEQLVQALEPAIHKNDALRELQDAANVAGIKLSPVDLPQLGPGFQEHWRPAALRELGIRRA